MIERKKVARGGWHFVMSLAQKRPAEAGTWPLKSLYSDEFFHLTGKTISILMLAF